MTKNIAIRSCNSYSWFGMYEPKKHKNDSKKMFQNNINYFIILLGDLYETKCFDM